MRILLFFVSLLLIQPQAIFAKNFNAPNRIKDIVNFEGIRENILVGYGLVVGLNATGDNLNNSNFTNQGLNDFLSKMGINVKGSNLKTKNIAAVTVTATLPAFSRQGSKIDVTTSTIGDAKSLVGGTLLATPLLGADGEVYAVAQGQVSIAGFEALSNKSNVTTRAVATNGFITNGAIIEREIGFNLDSLNIINLALKNPDISTSVEIANIINSSFSDNIAKAIDPSTVELKISSEYKNNVVGLLARIENIEINTDTVAKVIIEESSGTITIGENVRISPIAVSQGNLSVKIGAGDDNPKKKKNEEKERGSQIRVIEPQSSLSELVEGLNALGVMPRDLINILENIKASGALQADIEVR